MTFLDLDDIAAFQNIRIQDALIANNACLESVAHMSYQKMPSAGNVPS
jgi:hypothetical protein